MIVDADFLSLNLEKLLESGRWKVIANLPYNIATEVVCTFDRGKKVPLRLVGVFVHPGQAEMLREGPTPELNPLTRTGTE